MIEDRDASPSFRGPDGEHQPAALAELSTSTDRSCHNHSGSLEPPGPMHFGSDVSRAAQQRCRSLYNKSMQKKIFGPRSRSSVCSPIWHCLCGGRWLPRFPSVIPAGGSLTAAIGSNFRRVFSPVYELLAVKLISGENCSIWLRLSTRKACPSATESRRSSAIFRSRSRRATASA